MSKEYIEKEALKAQFAADRWLDKKLRASAYFAATRLGYVKERTIEQVIDSVFPADVKPVVRGKWVTKEYMYGDHSVGQEDMWIERLAECGDQAYCSVCGEFALLDGGEECKLSNFCPNCGADMMNHDAPPAGMR